MRPPCRLLPRRRIPSLPEYAALAQVIEERRAQHGFLLTAWVFLPEHRMPRGGAERVAN